MPTIHQVCMGTHAAETKYFHCRFALRCKTEECDAPQNTGGAIHHHRLVNNSAKRCVIYRANKSNCDLYRKSNAAHTLTQKSNFPFVFAFFPSFIHIVHIPSDFDVYTATAITAAAAIAAAALSLVFKAI